MNVLILAISAGAGHIKAAEALKSCIEEKYPGSRTLLVDALRYINPIVDKLVVGSYINALKKSPKIYGKLYEIAESGDNLSEVSQTINRIISYKIRRLIRELQPDIVVCTHPFPLQMVTNLKRQDLLKSKIVTILTDYTIHPFWLHDEVEAYIVAHSGMMLDMINRGISKDIIHPLGIPVSKNFLKNYDKSETRKDLGLQDITTVLIMGGSLGFGELKETFMTLLNSDMDLQLILVAGKNQKLIKQAEKYAQKGKKPVKIYSFTDQIPELMAASDFIISKPGGLTISEALVKGLPLIIISPIPGQEEKNARFLLNSGVAARIYSKQNVEEVIHQVMGNPLRMKHMKEMARQLARPNACEDIVTLFEELIRK